MEQFDRRRLTEVLCSAAVNPAEWTSALENVAECTNSHGVLLLPVVGKLPFAAATRTMDRVLENYFAGEWHTRDLRYTAQSRLISNGSISDDDCLPPETRRSSPFYQDFIRANNLSGFAGVRLGRGNLVGILSLQRNVGQGLYSQEELRMLADLADSLDSVIQIAAALQLARAEASLEAFDFSACAGVLLDPRGYVVRVNTTAERLLGPDLQISHGRLHCRYNPANEQLGRTIMQLFRGDHEFTAPPVIVPKGNAGKLVIYPMRLPGLTDSPLSAFYGMLVITDTDAEVSAQLSTYQLVHGLTLAEARLADSIATGISLDDYAASRHLSKETVRNQLKAIFHKTGTNRQAELVAKLGNLFPGK